MMFRAISWIAAAAILAAACSGTGADDDSSRSETTAAAATTETTATTVASTTTIPATTSSEAVTTTEAASTTSTTTTEPPVEVNPPDVEAWWCGAFEAAAGQSPVDFAQGLADDFRHGYTDMPAGTLEEGAEQVALVSCDPDYGRAVAEALVQ
jgi:hypothetical protein